MVFMVPGWFVMVPGWFFMVFLRNVPALNCILARRSSLGLPPEGGIGPSIIKKRWRRSFVCLWKPQRVDSWHSLCSFAVAWLPLWRKEVLSCFLLNNRVRENINHHSLDEEKDMRSRERSWMMNLYVRLPREWRIFLQFRFFCWGVPVPALEKWCIN